MQATIATRKPVDELTASDLEAFPVWEFAMDEEEVEEQDETWVKPVPTSEVPADGFSLSVAAVLKLANGRVYPGVMFCDTHAGLDIAAAERQPKARKHPKHLVRHQHLAVTVRPGANADRRHLQLASDQTG